MRTPIVLLIFNRPHHLQRVLERVFDARPPKLFIVADGPRNDEDKELCAQARDLVSNISWPAEVQTNFSEINLGGYRRIPSGLDWVFAQVPEAIILEDDCLAGPEFFMFCEEMLERFRDDSRIGIISGNNFVAPGMRCPESYYFSKYPHIWGWATWRRTWSLFDFHMRSWLKAKSRNLLGSVFTRAETIAFWKRCFDGVGVRPVGWDAKLVYTCLANNLLNVQPAQNLVSNIGWGRDASHAFDVSSPLANIPIGTLTFPLCHPDFVYCWREADEATEAAQFSLSEVAEVDSTDEGSAPLPLESFCQKLTTTIDTMILQIGQEVSILVRIENSGHETWPSTGRFPVNVSYKWFDGAQLLPIEGERTALPRPIPAGHVVNMDVRVIAPNKPGKFTLRITLVQENVAWFMTKSGTFLELPVTVK
jgi:hypothetical protein